MKRSIAVPAPKLVFAAPGQSIDSEAVALLSAPLVTGNVVQTYVEDGLPVCKGGTVRMALRTCPAGETSLAVTLAVMPKLFASLPAKAYDVLNVYGTPGVEDCAPASCGEENVTPIVKKFGFYIAGERDRGRLSILQGRMLSDIRHQAQRVYYVSRELHPKVFFLFQRNERNKAYPDHHPDLYNGSQ